MSLTQIATGKALYRRFRNLSDSHARQVLEFIDDLEGHEPNEETVRAIEESMNPENLLGPYDSIEAMFEDFGINVDAQSIKNFQA
jgi:hypothetical protein